MEHACCVSVCLLSLTTPQVNNLSIPETPHPPLLRQHTQSHTPANPQLSQCGCRCPINTWMSHSAATCATQTHTLTKLLNHSVLSDNLHTAQCSAGPLLLLRLLLIRSGPSTSWRRSAPGTCSAHSKHTACHSMDTFQQRPLSDIVPT